MLPAEACYECKGTEYAEERIATSLGSGCLLIVVGLLLTPFLIGIPIAVYGIYLSEVKEITVRCAQCRRVYSHTQRLSAAGTAFMVMVGFVGVATFYAVFSIFWSTASIVSDAITEIDIEEVAAIEIGPQKKEVAEEIEYVRFGDTYESEYITASVSGARVTRLLVEDSIGDVTESANEHLVVTVRFENIDSRRVLSFDELIFGDYFALHDDFGNRIRGVAFGFFNEVLGALRDTDDLYPGEWALHDIVFVIPPPSTKHLVLSVDMQAFGLDGTAYFKIPAENIRGFSE